ncbi:MAG: hypothetical protein JWN53_1092 [Gemmatimonadetes bacterium]|jgi:hypothetical protein|nr:hypothetical protein [Gemmatimonadota bacterium]
MSKPDINLKTDRPESGGADKDMQRESSGLLDRDKEKFAQEEAEKRAEAPEQRINLEHAPYSVGSERNPDPHNK